MNSVVGGVEGLSRDQVVFRGSDWMSGEGRSFGRKKLWGPLDDIRSRWKEMDRGMNHMESLGYRIIDPRWHPIVSFLYDERGTWRKEKNISPPTAQTPEVMQRWVFSQGK